MNSTRILAFLLVASLTLQPVAVWGQEYRFQAPDYSRGPDTWPKLWNAFETPDIPQIDMANSPRLEELISEAKLYLSLNDAIALAIENNLDLEVSRYNPLIADTDVLRARSGQQLRGVQTQISTLSTGLSTGGGGAGARGGNVTGVTGRAGGGGGGGGGAGDASSFFGTQAVNLDPAIFGGIDWGHFSNPQTSDFVTGTNTFINEASNSTLGVRQGFLTGTTAALLWANTASETNSRRANFNPSLRSNVTFQLQQPLLRGFGIAVNRRNIVVARRNREISDLGFRQQVIEVVTRVQNLYWDLVSLNANLRAAQEALALAEKLYQDNRRRVEIGTLAPIEVVRAEAEVAARQEEVTIAETQLQQQETLLKNAISTNGLASPSLMYVRIVPTDQISVPTDESIPPLEELIDVALRERPDLEQNRIEIGNRDINLRAIRNARLPRVDISVDLTNNGLAGQVNPLFVPEAGQEPFVSDYFLGGLPTSLGQIFRRNFPDYQVRLDVNIPLRNRQAQADLTANLLERRQAQIRLNQTENAIRLEVMNAVIGLEQARARYDASVKSRILQEQTLAAEQKKFDLGASTIFLVVQAQRDLALARFQEIAAENNYALARVELDRALGRTLEAAGVTFEEAYQGVVDRPADPIPTVPPQPALVPRP